MKIAVCEDNTKDRQKLCKQLKKALERWGLSEPGAPAERPAPPAALAHKKIGRGVPLFTSLLSRLVKPFDG